MESIYTRCRNCGSPEGFDCSYCGPVKKKQHIKTNQNQSKERELNFFKIMLFVLPGIGIIFMVLARIKSDIQKQKQVNSELQKLKHKLLLQEQKLQTIKTKTQCKNYYQ